MSTASTLPTFLGETVPVTFLARLEDVVVDGRTVTLRVATVHHEPLVQDYYGTSVETVFQEPEPGVPVTLRLDVCTAEILRLRSHPGAEVPDIATPMVVGTFDDPVELAVEHGETAVIVATHALRVTFVREPFRIEVRDRTGTLLFATRPVDLDGLRRSEQRWNPAEERWIFSNRYAYPWGVSGERAFASFELAHDERIHGFGEGFGRFDKHGTEQRLWLQEAFSNTSPASYKQVPFYLSSRGYGLYVNTSNAVTFNVGTLDHTALSVIVDDTALLDVYLLAGPSPREILPRYTAVTGAPAVPPRWSFGLWMSRITYESQAEVEQVARELREHRIPCDVIHIDTGWFPRDYVCEFRFGPQFPDPAAMTAALAEQGFRVTLWQWPNLRVDSEVFDEAVAGGYLARTASGHTYLVQGGYGEPAGVIDYSNPAAVAWMQAKFADLFALGIAAIKVDYGDGAPADARWVDAPSEAMHNRYPLDYQRAIWEATEQAHGEGEALLWARSAWAGSQRYPVHWSGDGVARFEDLACVLRSALSFGLSGFPFYSHDIGGFTGVPSPELYVRWAQFGLFSSHARTHGHPPREPWRYGAEAEAIFRRYTELRYRLLPYLWTQALACGRTSLPMVRALVIDFPDDPVAALIDDQYLFGPDLLVAPVLDEGLARRVYLPAGTWVDFWSKQPVEGGRFLRVEAPLDTLPLFVRGGAVLPLGPLVQWTGERPLDPLTLELYAPGDAGSSVLSTEDRTEIAVSYRREGGGLVVEIGETPGRVEVVVHGGDLAGATAASDGPGPHLLVLAA